MERLQFTVRISSKIIKGQKLDTSFKMLTPHLTQVKLLNRRICLTQPDKKNLFGGKWRNRGRGISVHWKTKKHFRGKSETELAHVQSFTDFNQKKKKASQKVQRRHLCFYLAKQRYIRKTCLCLSYFMFDNFSAFLLLSW